MIRTLTVPAILTVVALAIPTTARAQVSGPPTIAGADVFFSQVVEDPATGTTTYLTITGSRSSLRQAGEVVSTTIDCEVDVMQYDAAGNLLHQGTGFADPGATTLTVAMNLMSASLEATLIYTDFYTGETLPLDVALTFEGQGPKTHTVTTNGDPSSLLIKDSRAAVVSGSVQLGDQALDLDGQPATLERSKFYDL